MACGQFLGHYLSASAMMHAATGEAALKAKVTALVAELARCQAALGPRGFLHTLKESDFDRLEAGAPVWGNYYTIHKVLAGLLDVYDHCGNQQALEVARKLAGWVERRTRGQSVAWIVRTWHRDLHVEFGGINEALVRLYEITGDASNLEAARRFDDEGLYGPLSQGRDALLGLHVNTAIPKIVGAARAYEATGAKRYRDVAAFFWRQVVDHRSYCTGGTSNLEHWRTPPDRLAHELSANTQECCCTYNMLKLTRHLFQWTAAPHVADYYERALLNGILGTQNPEDGMTMYYVPLASGYWKTFASPSDSFWCCTGTGIESFAKSGDSIYFHDEEGLWVNLFIASELHWPEKGLRVRQETSFPEQQGTTLVITAPQPVELALRIRVPYWAKRGVAAKLNGLPLGANAPSGSYLTMRRQWQNGDRLEVHLPMSLHAHPMPDDKSLAAMMYGPLVLAGRLGTEGLTPAVLRTATPAPQGTPVEAPWFVTDSDDLDSWIQPVAGKPLTFTTHGQAADVTLVPFYKLFGERYSVYWRVYRRGSAEQQAMLARETARKARLARTIDVVDIGNARSETSHALAGEQTADGPGGGRHWRHAAGGGWFSYRLKVAPDHPATLVCAYWGSDEPPRTFDILVDGTRIATQSLDRNRPDEFFEVEYSIPPELTRGKTLVTVRFQAHPSNTAGGVFGMATLRAKLAD